jgi:hypothetical protein
VKKDTEEQVPLLYIERSPLIWLASLALAALFIYWNYTLLKDVNPAGFLMLIPSAFFSFQTLWLLLNPFAAVYDTRVELRQSLFHNQQRFYTDIRKISQDNRGRLYITYTDDEVERINLFGIRKSGINILKSHLDRHISLTENNSGKEI